MLKLLIFFAGSTKKNIKITQNVKIAKNVKIQTFFAGFSLFVRSVDQKFTSIILFSWAALSKDFQIAKNVKMDIFFVVSLALVVPVAHYNNRLHSSHSGENNNFAGIHFAARTASGFEGYGI